MTNNSWGNITDPTLHNPESFRYLVHADTGCHNTTRYFADDLDAITELDMVSASLIDSAHSRTFASTFGIIIEVPVQDVLAADCRDLNSKNNTSVALSMGVKDPEVILEGSTDFMWNEILINPKDIMIRGITYTPRNRRSTLLGMLHPLTIDDSRELAMKNGLPFVLIE